MLGEPFTERQPWLGVIMLFQELRPSFLPVQFSLDDLPAELSLSQLAPDADQIT